MQTNDKTNSVYISGIDSKIFDEITKKYKIVSDKTYHPPFLMNICGDKLFSLASFR